MISQPLDLPAAGPARTWRIGLIVAAVVVISCLAISGRSLWIDEACTAVKTGAPTLQAWWQQMAPDRSSELQMPLYLVYVWGWTRLLGASEWSLRAANLPWFVAGAVAFILAFPPGDRRRSIAAWVALLSPFAWYYLDEARPYGMQMGASLLVAASLARLTGDSRMAEAGERVQVGVFVLGIVALSGSSLLGMVWAGAGLVALPALLPVARTVALARRHWFLWLAGGSLLLLLAAYYLWTLAVGARASAVATTTWGSVFFAGYELLGWSGLGPGRLEMRSAGPAALRPYWAWLAPYAIATLILIGAALRQELKCRNRKHLVAALCYSVPPAFILAVGCVRHFRVLGRHLAPFVPVLWFILISGVCALWSRRAAWARAVVLLFCLLSLVSCLSLRFSPRHEKDNYRAAAVLAKAALRNGQAVWWNAAQEGARYYGVPVATRPGSADAALLVMNPTRDLLEALPVPQVIIASKPDVYDGQMALAEYLRERSFSPARKLAAFVIWERNKQ